MLAAIPFAAQSQPVPVCDVPVEPGPVNPTFGRPTEEFLKRDHLFVHSPTHPQGAPDTVKIAAAARWIGGAQDVDQEIKSSSRAVAFGRHPTLLNRRGN